MAKETIDIDVKCKNVMVHPDGRQVIATLDTLDLNDFLSQVDLNLLVDIIGVETILDAIDKDDAVKFYGITEAE